MRNAILAGLLGLGFSCGGTQGAEIPVATPDQDVYEPVGNEPPKSLGKTLPVDERITVGKLDNGMTYYVLEHKKPEKRAQLWLAVNAGALQEDDDQQGLAHFVEHMAFNGTAKYQKMAIVNYLERIGMKFGPDVNAYTSFDETVYILQVPTDDQKIVDKGFDILHQWAGAVAFEGVEVEKERGVVMEEWRLGRGAWARVRDKAFPVIFHGSKYAKRLPIGKAKIIKGAPRAALTRYYKDWYRPDLMAIIAVGDFSKADIEKKIKAKFSDLKGPTKARPRAPVPVPPHQETLVSVETDPEMTQTQISIYNKFAHRPEVTDLDYRRSIVDSLYHSMLNERLGEIRNQPESPFVWAYSSTSSFVRAMDAFSRGAMVKEGRVKEGLARLFEEVVRVERHGFGKGEFERAKKEVLRGYQQSVKERNKQNGRRFTGEILRHFLENEMMPGIEAELALVERFLPTVTLSELNTLAKKWGGSANRVITISGPAKMKKPSKAEILSITRDVEKKQIAPWKDSVSNKPLMAKLPKRGAIIRDVTRSAIGVTEWHLSNGAKVIIKPTDFKNDQVLLSAFSPGGTSQVGDVDFYSADNAGGIVSGGGIGEFSTTQLSKKLAGKVAYVNPWIGELEEGLRGSASPDDLETLMQMTHLRFTAPRKDMKAFASWKARTVERVRNRRLDPQRAFFDDMSAFSSKNHLRRRPMTPELLSKVNFETAHRIYSERFGDAGDFTFFFVGNIDLKTFRPLVEQYLASLPSKGRKEKWKDVGVRRPRGVKKLTVNKGKEPKASFYLTFHGPQKWSKDAQNDMRMLSEVLRIRLREVLREDMGGVYGVYSGGGISRRPRQERSFSIYFGCAPENVEKLKKAVFDEIATIAKKGIGPDYIEKAKIGRVRQHELDMKNNYYWSQELSEFYRYGKDPIGILKHQEMVDKISSKRVKAAARKFLRNNQYVLGILLPEK